MSTILDAIRKAEEQRHDDAVPSLEAIVQQKRKGGGRKNSRSSGWLVWVALAIVIAVSGYLYKDSITRVAAQAKTLVAGKANSLLKKTGNDNLLSRRYPAIAVLPRGAAENKKPAGVDGGVSGLSDRQRQLLDAVRFDVISYSRDNAKRFVMTGGRTYREGDTLEGFTIDSIGADGVTLNVAGDPVLLRP